MMNNLDIKQIRYKNAITLRDLAGGVSDFAKKVDRSQPQMSNLVGDSPIKPIGHKLARYFETVFGKPSGWLDSPHYEIWEPEKKSLNEQSADYIEVKPRALARLIPIIGKAQLGDGGYWDAIDYPVGHGDGYIQWFSDDVDTYAVQGVGNSMAPRIRHNEYAIIEPNRTVFNGDEVFIVVADGRRMIKTYLYSRDDLVHLESTNSDFEKIVLNKKDIITMHSVVGIAKYQARI